MNPEHYEGREQTYIKHLFLKEYLFSVATIVLHKFPGFVYVDGFSGPWQNKDESYADTSFSIALKTLRAVRQYHRKQGRDPRIRCLFIEKEHRPFRALNEFCKRQDDFEILRLNASFEDSVDEIRRYIGTDFSLSFVDPTGWTGFSLTKIRPLLRLRGEVVVNFMYEFLNRFTSDERDEIRSSQDDTFGDANWRDDYRLLEGMGYPRHEAIVKVYIDRILAAGTYEFATYSPILRPNADRVHFFLTYFTNNRKGLEKFAEAEKRVSRVQTETRADVERRRRQQKREQATGSIDMFGSDAQDPVKPGLEPFRHRSLAKARQNALDYLEASRRLQFPEFEEVMIREPLVWSSDAKDVVDELRSANPAFTPNWRPRQKRADEHTILVFL